jgi:hypothetical protein
MELALLGLVLALGLLGLVLALMAWRAARMTVLAEQEVHQPHR